MAGRALSLNASLLSCWRVDAGGGRAGQGAGRCPRPCTAFQEQAMRRERSSMPARILIRSTQRRLGVPVGRLRRLVRFVAGAEGRTIDQVDIAIVGRKRMATLNETYLGRPGPTDVLSFDLTEKAGGVCAQIIACSDVAIGQARRRGHEAWKELLLYVTHGLLHTMGYDDLTDTDAKRMHSREDQLLEAFGIGRVYAGP